MPDRNKPPSNPKNLHGINVPERFIWREQPMPVTVYHTCNNCGNKWETEIKVILVTGNMTYKKYDYCSECHEKELDKLKK
jgi:hypothetical protein